MKVLLGEEMEWEGWGSGEFERAAEMEVEGQRWRLLKDWMDGSRMTKQVHNVLHCTALNNRLLPQVNKTKVQHSFGRQVNAQRARFESETRRASILEIASVHQTVESGLWDY